MTTELRLLVYPTIIEITSLSTPLPAALNAYILAYMRVPLMSPRMVFLRSLLASMATIAEADGVGAGGGAAKGAGVAPAVEIMSVVPVEVIGKSGLEESTATYPSALGTASQVKITAALSWVCMNFCFSGLAGAPCGVRSVSVGVKPALVIFTTSPRAMLST